VDALPAAKFHPQYNDSTWRRWRKDHISYIDRLLSTVDVIPQAILGDLTGIAITYEPELVGNIALELFAEAVSNRCPKELGTAELLLACLVRQVGQQAEVIARLRSLGYEAHHQTAVPPNDGGISLGQIAVANARLIASQIQLCRSDRMTI
jgi:hypothetical protein